MIVINSDCYKSLLQTEAIIKINQNIVHSILWMQQACGETLEHHTITHALVYYTGEIIFSAAAAAGLTHKR